MTDLCSSIKAWSLILLQDNFEDQASFQTSPCGLPSPSLRVYLSSTFPTAQFCFFHSFSHYWPQEYSLKKLQPMILSLSIYASIAFHLSSFDIFEEKDFFFFWFFFFSFIFISWRLITLQYCSGFCHTLTWISHGFTCVPHPDPRSHVPLRLIPLGLPSAPGPSTCLMHPTRAGDLFHPR